MILLWLEMWMAISARETGRLTSCRFSSLSLSLSHWSSHFNFNPLVFRSAVEQLCCPSPTSSLVDSIDLLFLTSLLWFLAVSHSLLQQALMVIHRSLYPGKQLIQLQILPLSPYFQIQFPSFIPSSIADLLLWPIPILCPYS